MKKIFGIVLSAALLAGCAKEMSEKVALNFTPKDFTASLDATRTTLGTDGHSVLWSTGDQIGVFYKQEMVLVAYKLFGTGGKSTGYFLAADGDKGYTQENEALMYYAIYPFDQKATQKNGILNVTLPGTQNASIGFDPKAAVLAAKSNVESLEFQNTEGLLKIVLKHEIDGAQNVTVSKIVLTSKSHPLSGLATINAGTDFKAVVDVEGDKTITFNCTDPNPIAIYADKDTPFYIVVPETDFEANDLMVSVYFNVSYGDRSSDMSTSFSVPAFKVEQNKIATITKTIDVSASSITGRIIFDSSMPDALKYMFVPQPSEYSTKVNGTTSNGKSISLEVISISDNGQAATFRVADGSYCPSVADGDVTYTFTEEYNGVRQKYAATASVNPTDKSLTLNFTSQTAVLCVKNWKGVGAINAIEVAGPEAMTVDGMHTPSNNFFRTFSSTSGPVYIGVQDPAVNAINKIVIYNTSTNPVSAYYFNPNGVSGVELTAGVCTTYEGASFVNPPSIRYTLNETTLPFHSDGASPDWGYATNGVSLYGFKITTLPKSEEKRTGTIITPGELTWIPNVSEKDFCSIPTPVDGNLTFAFRPGNPTNVEFTDKSVSLSLFSTEQVEALWMANSILVSDITTLDNNNARYDVKFNIQEALIKLNSWKFDGATGTAIDAVIVRGYSSSDSNRICGNYAISVMNDHATRTDDVVYWYVNNYSQYAGPTYQEGTILARIIGADQPVPIDGTDKTSVYIVVPTSSNGYNVITSIDIRNHDNTTWYRYEIPDGGWKATTGEFKDLTGVNFKKTN